MRHNVMCETRDQQAMGSAGNGRGKTRKKKKACAQCLRHASPPTTLDMAPPGGCSAGAGNGGKLPRLKQGKTDLDVDAVGSGSGLVADHAIAHRAEALSNKRKSTRKAFSFRGVQRGLAIHERWSAPVRPAGPRCMCAPRAASSVAPFARQRLLPPRRPLLRRCPSRSGRS
jgi:hypothetical protein